MTIFRQGLEKYHKLGPPRLQCAPLTVEEAAYNTAHYSAEGEEEIQELKALEHVEEVILSKYNENDSQVLQHILPNPPGTFLICECGSLCDNLEGSFRNPSVNISEEERIKDLNSLKLQLEEGGLEISYRCIRCRDCLDCKNSDKTEQRRSRDGAHQEVSCS